MAEFPSDPFNDQTVVPEVEHELIEDRAAVFEMRLAFNLQTVQMLFS